MSGVKKPLLIGIYGKARSGKDTAADYITQVLHLRKYALAEPLKQMLKCVFGDNFHDGDRERICPEAGVSYRAMMQTLGTEWRNTVNKDLWLNLAAKEWQRVQELSCVEQGGIFHGMTQGMIISDIRFDSEAEWIKQQGGTLIEITRPGLAAIGIQGHASEAGINPGLTDITISNSSDIQYLYATLDSVVKEYLSRI